MYIFFSAACHLENCVPVDEYNKRFGEIDRKFYWYCVQTKKKRLFCSILELLKKQHEIYVAPHSIENPYYLCVKTSKLVKENTSMLDRKQNKSIDYVYGKKELDHEYWFSVPKDK